MYKNYISSFGKVFNVIFKWRGLMKRFAKIAAGIGALTAAVLLGVNCAQNSSDDSYYNDNQNKQDELESYYFLRHAFMEENASIDPNASTATKAAWASQHYTAARAYLKDKILAFEDRVDRETTDDNFLKPMLEEGITWGGQKRNYYLDADEVDYFLSSNNLVFPYVLGGISGKYAYAGGEFNRDNYDDFIAHYNALAIRAYNDSAGTLRDSKTLPFNQERGKINSDLFNAPSRPSYAANDYEKVEGALHKMLQTVAQESGVSLQTLVDAVNLSLLHTGLWGARDLAAQSGIQLSDSATYVSSPSNRISYLTLDKHIYEIEAGYAYQAGIEYVKAKQQQSQQDMSR